MVQPKTTSLLLQKLYSNVSVSLTSFSQSSLHVLSLSQNSNSTSLSLRRCFSFTSPLFVSRFSAAIEFACSAVAHTPPSSSFLSSPSLVESPTPLLQSLSSSTSNHRRHPRCPALLLSRFAVMISPCCPLLLLSVGCETSDRSRSRRRPVLHRRCRLRRETAGVVSTSSLRSTSVCPITPLPWPAQNYDIITGSQKSVGSPPLSHPLHSR